MTTQRFPELGYYALPGHAPNAKSIFEEVSQGDELGLGSVWISERFNTKDIGVMSGIAAAKTPNMGIASGLIGNLPLRHPLTLAGYASTMATITDNRFTLGIGRGVDAVSNATGTPRLNFKHLEEYVTILRTLWNGEIVNYDGPLGNFTSMGLTITLDAPPPIVMAAMGDKTCAWAGRHCDGIVYNSLWTPEAIAHSTAIARKSAEEAGKDPDAFKVWAIQVTACETSEEDTLNYIYRRMNTYVIYPPFFQILSKYNGWDNAKANEIRAALAKIDGKPKIEGGLGDEHTTRDLDEIRRMRDLYPEEWIYRGNAVGSADDCAKATLERFEAGADGVLLHGSPAAKLKPLLDKWPEYRPAERFAGRSVNPGL